MKNILALIVLIASIVSAKTITVNRSTKYEAKVSLKGDSLYISQKGKKRKLYIGDEALDDDSLRIDDINFDGVDDIAIVDMRGYSGVNLFYKIFLAKDGEYKESKVSLSNYKLYPRYKSVLSEYKDGPRHFTELYEVDNSSKMWFFVKYEKYRDDNLCFIKKIDLESLTGEEKYNKVLSCKALLRKHKAENIFAKIVKKKAHLYNKDFDKKSNGMYLIKGDIIELIDGDASSDKVLARFRGKRVVTKYIKVKDLAIVPPKTYEYKHPIEFYDNGKWIKEDTQDGLVLQKIGAKRYHFVLDTVAKNAHTCSMEGVLKDRGDYLLYKDKACKLKLYKSKNSIKTEDKNMACKDSYCGMHAFVGGLEFKEVN